MAATSNCDLLGTAEPEHVLSTAYHRHAFVIGASVTEAAWNSLPVVDSVHGIVVSHLELLLELEYTMQSLVRHDCQ